MVEHPSVCSFVIMVKIKKPPAHVGSATINFAQAVIPTKRALLAAGIPRSRLHHGVRRINGIRRDGGPPLLHGQ